MRRNPRRCAGDGEGAWSERCADNTGFQVSGDDSHFLRQSLDIEYPLGTDLIFVNAGGGNNRFSKAVQSGEIEEGKMAYVAVKAAEKR